MVNISLTVTGCFTYIQHCLGYTRAFFTRRDFLFGLLPRVVGLLPRVVPLPHGSERFAPVPGQNAYFVFHCFVLVGTVPASKI